MRIWHYHGGLDAHRGPGTHGSGWVKVNVPEDGSELVVYSFQYHEEGFSSEETRYWIGPGSKKLFRSCYTDGSDCDGRMSTTRDSWVYIDHNYITGERLVRKTGQYDEYAPPGGRIDWQRGESSQRDYSAEAMGY